MNAGRIDRLCHTRLNGVVDKAITVVGWIVLVALVVAVAVCVVGCTTHDVPDDDTTPDVYDSRATDPSNAVASHTTTSR